MGRHCGTPGTMGGLAFTSGPDHESGPPSAADEPPQSPSPPSRRRRPRGYGLVLLTIVLAIVITSIAQDAAVTQAVSLVLIGAALLRALHIADVHPQTERLAAILVVVGLLIGLLSSLPAVTFVPGSLGL